MGLLIFIGIFVLLAIWGISIRNNIVRYFNATKRAWAEVANFERQKIKTLETLEQTLSQYTQFEKSTLENIATACIHVYRDILIFKKEGKVIGTAKICFDCMSKQIKGTTANTENFGQDGDYEKLEKILR